MNKPIGSSKPRIIRKPFSRLDLKTTPMAASTTLVREQIESEHNEEVHHQEQQLQESTISDSIATSTLEITSREQLPSIQDEPIIIVDNEKNSQQDFLIDLTKDVIDSDIAVIREVRKSRANIRFRTRGETRNSTLDSTIVIDDDKNDINEIITLPSSSSMPNNQNPFLQPSIVIHIGESINEDRSSSVSVDNAAGRSNPFKRQRLLTNQTSSTLTSDSSSKKTELSCPICLENLDEIKCHNKTLMVTFCGHIMCNQCVDLTFKSSGPNIKSIPCPTCRTKVTRQKIHGLYI